jgi:hypothetical protein
VPLAVYVDADTGAILHTEEYCAPAHSYHEASHAPVIPAEFECCRCRCLFTAPPTTECPLCGNLYVRAVTS